jgi:uncharacterized protein
MRKHIKRFIYLIVFTGFSVASAGSFDDFFSAIRQDNSGAIERLLKRGFDANTKNEKGQPGLLLAIREGSIRVIEVLMAWPKTDIEARNLQDESALMIAALKGPPELAARLVKRGADVNKTGWTPLHYAATSGSLPTIRMLLENHAYIDAESPNGTTPLMMAAQYGSADAVRLLLAEGADPTLRNQRNFSALEFAHNSERPEVMSLIAAAQRKALPKGAW